MFMTKCAGLFAVVPVSALLTVSYFVLVANKKQQAGGLKTFGYVTAALLLIAAALISSCAIYTSVTGRPLMGCMLGKMMKHGDMMKCHMPESMKDSTAYKEGTCSTGTHGK